MDNSLSSYMNQRSKTGEFWKERWFVLTIATQTLICYDNHLVRTAISIEAARAFHINFIIMIII